MSSEKRKAESSALPEYIGTIYGESVPKLCTLEPIECFKQIVKRAEEFEAKVLPVAKEALGDRVHWLEKPKIRVQDFDIDDWETCRPFPMIHFATLAMVARKDDKGRAWIRERWWCYCPTNDWIVITTGRDGFPEAMCRVTDIDQMSHMLKPLKGYRVSKP